MTVGDKIKQEREKRGISKYRMALDIGVGYNSLLKWERNEIFPSLMAACDVADYFGITLDELVGRTEVHK